LLFFTRKELRAFASKAVTVLASELLSDSLLNRFTAAAKDLACDKTVQPSKQPVIDDTAPFATLIVAVVPWV
jgi:hypothetical protein